MNVCIRHKHSKYMDFKTKMYYCGCGGFYSKETALLKEVVRGSCVTAVFGLTLDDNSALPPLLPKLSATNPDQKQVKHESLMLSKERGRPMSAHLLCIYSVRVCTPQCVHVCMNRDRISKAIQWLIFQSLSI